MSAKPPLMDLPIKTSKSGFYSGFNKDVAIVSKLIIAVLVVWALVFPEQAGRVLNAINGFILANTAYWYTWIIALFFFTCCVLAAIPATGKLKLGVER